MNRRLWPLIAVVVVSLAFPFAALAQQPTTGNIEIHVVDKDGKPLPGATVKSSGPLGDRADQTNINGYVEFKAMAVGTYRIRVELHGFDTIEVPNVDVSAGQRTKLPVVLASGKIETVTVVSSAPLVDPRQMEVSSNFKTSESAESLPIGRNFTEAVAFAPGVVSGLGTGEGNYSIGGSSGLENSYIIDGVNITDAGYGGVGTYSINYGSLGTGITADFLEEIQVKTGGFEAEYGQALGGVVNGVVRSGTNDFTGSVKVYLTPDSLEAQGFDAHLPTGAINTHDRNETDVGVSAGGPFAKDRAFWFAAYNPVSHSDKRYIEQIDNPIFAIDPMATSSYPNTDLFPGAFSNRKVERNRDNYAAKFNFLASSNHWFELTAFGDPSDGDGASGIETGDVIFLGDSDGDGTLDPGATKAPAGFAANGVRSTIDYGADQQSLRYNGLFSGDWFVQAQVSHRKNDFSETSLVDDFRYRDRRLFLEWIISSLSGMQTIGQVGQPLSGGSGFDGPTSEETYDYSIKVSKTFGNHEVKFGAQYYDLEYAQPSTYSGPSFTLPFPDGMGGTIPIQTTSGGLVDVRGGIPTCTACVASTGNPYYRVIRGRFSPLPGPTMGEETAIFVQDTWNVSDNWTVKLGLRSTDQKLTGSEGFVLPLSRTSGTVFTSTPQTFEAGSYTFDQEISPRAGVSFDPWGNGKGKLFVHYARYFERVPSDLAVRQFSNEIGTSNFEFTDPALTNWRGTSISLQGLSQTRVEDGTKLPYIDEYVLGWEQLIRPDLSFKVRGIYRDQGRVLEDVQFSTLESVENFYYYYDVNGNGLIDADGNGDGMVDHIEIPFPEICTPTSSFDLNDPNAVPDGSCFNFFGEYVMANPGQNTAGSFGTPKRQYQAVEVEFDKRMSNNWRMIANYRYSKLRGNYEGLYRNDNTQSDPNITSLFDFPDSHLMRGQYNSGPLNTDRPHVMHILGSYVFDNGVELGGGFNWQSGTPRTALLAHPNYQNSGELPGQDPLYYVHNGSMWVQQANTGSFLAEYTDAPRGSLGRLPDLATMDVHGGYTANFGAVRLKFTVDIFNLFNTQEADQIDDAVEFIATIPNANFNKILSYQNPRAVRAAVNLTW